MHFKNLMLFWKIESSYLPKTHTKEQDINVVYMYVKQLRGLWVMASFNMACKIYCGNVKHSVVAAWKSYGL